MKSLMTVENWPGLCIERHEVRTGLRTLQSWPPRDDFPIVADAKGNVVCKFGDDVWDLSLWSRKPERISLKHSNVRIVEGEADARGAAHGLPVLDQKNHISALLGQ